ncbi:MAG TPA: phosphonopyruvate decarboxylase [Gemmataceae bacterium]|nr:phosphonopyruvate decarboxylase [Gemmataceae bacterium]
MIRAEFFAAALRRAGFGLCTGTPCSYLKPLINRAIDGGELRYVGAANEGEAVAIACGAELGGVPSVVMFQNSGLGNAVNPLTSLALPCRIPVLVITTWRGQPGGPPDEPQHEVMGRITPDLLNLMGIPAEVVPQDEPGLEALLGRATDHMKWAGTPYGLVLKEGTVAPYSLRARPEPDVLLAAAPALSRPSAERHNPDDVLRAVRSAAGDDDVILATTGYTGRALYALGDAPNQFYMVGSMGCVASLGLGLAKARPGRRVVVIDGDGAMLMRLEALATIGHDRPDNFVHVLLDNGVHDSTGGQATVSASADLAAVAAACGYPRVLRVAGPDALAKVLRERGRGPTFLHVRTGPRADGKLPRPTMTPAAVAERLRRRLGGVS